jgi:hypothetical protein
VGSGTFDDLHMRAQTREDLTGGLGVASGMGNRTCYPADSTCDDTHGLEWSSVWVVDITELLDIFTTAFICNHTNQSLRTNQREEGVDFGQGIVVRPPHNVEAHDNDTLQLH